MLDFTNANSGDFEKVVDDLFFRAVAHAALFALSPVILSGLIVYAMLTGNLIAFLIVLIAAPFFVRCCRSLTAPRPECDFVADKRMPAVHSSAEPPAFLKENKHWRRPTAGPDWS